MVQMRLLAVSLFTESFNKAMRDAEKRKIEQSVKNIEKTAMQRVSPNSLSTTLTTSVEGRKGQNSVSSLNPTISFQLSQAVVRAFLAQPAFHSETNTDFNDETNTDSILAMNTAKQLDEKPKYCIGSHNSRIEQEKPN